MQTLSAAFKYLTIWHFVGACEPDFQTIGRAAKYFPVVGLVLGLTLALTNYVLAPYLAAEILSVALIALWAAATGGLHLGGVRNTFAAFGTNAPQDKGRTYHSLGVTAIVLVILFKNAAAESMDERLTLSLLLTPLLARWALLTFLYGDHTQFDEIPRLIAQHLTFLQLFVGTVGTLAVITYFLGRSGLWIALIVSVRTLSTRSLLRRRHGMLTHAHSGAVVEFGEALSLILLATL